MHWSQSKFIICTVLLHKMLFFRSSYRLSTFYFWYFLSNFKSFTFVVIRYQRIFGIFCLFEIFRHSHGIFQLFFCFIYFFGPFKPFNVPNTLVRFSATTKHTSQIFFGWCYCYCCCYNQILLLPFSVFYMCIQSGPKVYFPFSRCVRTPFYFLSIYYAVFNGFSYTRSLFISLFEPFILYVSKKKEKK